MTSYSKFIHSDTSSTLKPNWMLRAFTQYPVGENSAHLLDQEKKNKENTESSHVDDKENRFREQKNRKSNDALYSKWMHGVSSSLENPWENETITIYARIIPSEMIQKAVSSGEWNAELVTENVTNTTKVTNAQEEPFAKFSQDIDSTRIAHMFSSQMQLRLWSILDHLLDTPPYSKQSGRLIDFHSDIAVFLNRAYIGSRLYFQNVEYSQVEEKVQSPDEPQLCPSGTLFMEVFIVPTEVSESNLKQIEENKLNGNLAFQLKEWPEALKYYKAGVWLADREIQPPPSNTISEETKLQENKNDIVHSQGKIASEHSHSLQQLHALRYQCLSNLSQVYLNLNLPKKALEQSKHALQGDPRNIKVLFRKAVAERTLEQYDDALMTLQEALNYDPNNKAIMKEKGRVELLNQKYQQKSKRMIKAMFT